MTGVGSETVTGISVRPWPVVARSVAVVTVCMLPVFLTGALAVQIADELGLDPARLGLVAAFYFGVAALTSVPAGRVVDRIGPTLSSRLAAGGAAVSLLLIATVARNFVVLLVVVAWAGWCNSLGNLACNVTLARIMPPHRLGTSFGVKQSAVPLATLIAGVAVPAFALTIGWRWAFVVGAALAVVGVVLAPRIAVGGGRGERGAERAHGALTVIAVASLLASACATMLSIFLVSSAVAQGIDAGLAGLALTLGSVAGLVGRLLNGWLADRRRGGHITVVAACLVVGAVGLGLLALPGAPTLVLGAILGFGLGFSWQGLLQFAVVRLHPAAPAAASAIVQLGANAGNFFGPIGFGFVATHTTFPVAFTIAAAVELVAAAAMFLGRRMLLAHRARTES
jgi:MFS family permease